MPEKPAQRIKPLFRAAAPQRNAAAAYAELQVTSNYSFLRGASHPEELVYRAAELGLRAVAITDRHSLAGIVKAHAAAKEAGIPLVIGTAITLHQTLPQSSSTWRSCTDATEAQPSAAPESLMPFEVLLYPAGKTAYGRLCRLLSQGKLRSPKGRCLLTLEDLAHYQQGLFASVVIRNLRHPRLLAGLESLKSIFDCDRLSLIVSHTYGPDNNQHLDSLLHLGRLFDIPIAAANDVHYHIPERRKLQDVLTCIRRTCTLREAGFYLFQNAERCLKPPQEMLRLFSSLPQATRRTCEIADAALSFSLDQLIYQCPNEICPADKTPIQYLTELVWRGTAERYPQGIPPAVTGQIRHELALIEELHYEKYFLTVYDIVLFARTNSILCQGRGAAANSAVCYALGITAVDPDRINLLFERFISRERNEPPDIDIDFEHERREEVIQYIYRKYGRHRAALTASLITYRTRSAVRDVGKVFELSPGTIQALIKLLTRSESSTITAQQIRQRGLDPQDPVIRHTIDLAQEILGFPRHLSQHVGGFMISEQPLSEIVPIENAAMPERTVIEWDKDDIEQMGMLKIDVLGLGMLTAIKKALAMINEHRSGKPPLELHNIPAEDSKVYDMICRADTLGVFQIESRAQMSMLPRLKPRCYYDLVIEVAIVRPGPIRGGMVHPFLRRRCGEESVSYPSKAVEKILAPTLGVPIFQEQVMELAVAAAGFTPGEADNLRRAMAGWKSKTNLLARFKERLLEGMRQNGYSPLFAGQIFEQIKGFGEYGFPQSHAASFALLVYVSAWLKLHYPAAFAAALINSQPMGFYSPAQIIEDAKRHGVEVLPPDVNFSAVACSLEDNPIRRTRALRLGLCLVKGLELQQAQCITAAVHKHGRFTSAAKLFRESGASAQAMKTLARADAFSSFGLSRQAALWAVRKLRDDPLPLFDYCREKDTPAVLPPLSAKLEVIKDYEMLGLSLKAHPLSFLRTSLNEHKAATALELREDSRLKNGMRTAVCGMALVRQRPQTAGGVVFMTLEDETGMANLIIRPAVFQKYRDIICDSIILLAYGRLQRIDGVAHLLAEEFIDITGRLTEELRTAPRNFH